MPHLGYLAAAEYDIVLERVAAGPENGVATRMEVPTAWDPYAPAKVAAGRS